MEKVVAIFVACTMDLILCQDLPFIEEEHVFPDTDKCRAAVAKIVKKETEHRKTYGYPYPIVMGKCKWWLDERHIRREHRHE